MHQALAEPEVVSSGGIKLDIGRRKRGEEILLATHLYVYNLRVMEPERSVCSLRTTDPRVFGNQTCEVLDTIAKGKRLALKLVKGVIDTSPLVTAQVQGDGWAYQAF